MESGEVMALVWKRGVRGGVVGWLVGWRWFRAATCGGAEFRLFQPQIQPPPETDL